MENKTMRKVANFFLSLILLYFLSGICYSQDWPCWRGPNGDGISRETQWDPQTLNGGARILWKADIGQGHSAVSIQDGLLYTLGSRFLKKNGETLYEEIVFCLNASTGETVWKYIYPSIPMAHAGPRSTPTVDRSSVFTLGSKGHLFCFDRKSGKVIWKRDLVSQRLSGDSKWGFSTSPVVAGNILLLNVGSAGLALNKTSGEVIWKSDLPNWGLSSPVITKIEGYPVALLNTEYYLHAVKISDGKIVWTYPWGYCDTDPVLVGDNIYVSGGKPGRKRRRALLRISDGSMVKDYNQKRMNLAFQSGITYQGFVYGISWDKKRHYFQCFDLEAGKILWEQRLKDWAGFSMSKGYLILLEANGDLVILDASPKAYLEIARASVFNMKKDSPEDQPLTCWTSPVLCGGKIFVRNTYGEIACVDVSK
jgi:outer membrane protein assembly factor BamB